MTARTLIATALAVTALGASAATSNATPAPLGGCVAIAHRGGSGPGADDNTLAALQRAARYQARAEVDLMPVIGGIVAYHERRWEQYTTGTGQPQATTVAYARTLTTLRNGQPVPTLRQVLRTARVDDVPLLVELHRWREGWTPDRAAAVARLIEDNAGRADVWVTGTAGALNALPDDLVKVWRPDGDEISVDRAAKYGADVVQLPPIATHNDVIALRDAGIGVAARQSAPDTWPTWWAKGVHLIQTDRIAVYRNQCQEAHR